MVIPQIVDPIFQAFIIIQFCMCFLLKNLEQKNLQHANAAFLLLLLNNKQPS